MNVEYVLIYKIFNLLKKNSKNIYYNEYAYFQKKLQDICKNKFKKLRKPSDILSIKSIIPPYNFDICSIY